MSFGLASFLCQRYRNITLCKLNYHIQQGRKPGIGGGGAAKAHLLVHYCDIGDYNDEDKLLVGPKPTLPEPMV